MNVGIPIQISALPCPQEEPEKESEPEQQESSPSSPVCDNSNSSSIDIVQQSEAAQDLREEELLRIAELSREAASATSEDDEETSAMSKEFRSLIRGVSFKGASCSVSSFKKSSSDVEPYSQNQKELILKIQEALKIPSETFYSIHFFAFKKSL